MSSSGLVPKSDGSRFEPMDLAATPPRRLVVNVTAMDKTGKTRFCLTAPGPIAIFNFNRGLEGVKAPEIYQDKRIDVANYRVPKTERNAMAIAEATWDQFVADFLYFLDADYRTGVIDTGTETWELIRLARLGKLEGAGKARNYGALNMEYTELFNRIYDTDKNLLFTHKMKKEYVNDSATGNWELSGYNDMRSLVQVNVDLWYWDPEQAARATEKIADGTVKDPGFYLKVRNCRQSYQAVGEELIGDLIDFPTLAMLVFPDSEFTDWL